MASETDGRGWARGMLGNLCIDPMGARDDDLRARRRARDPIWRPPTIASRCG